MNAHSRITRDELDLMLQEPFAVHGRIPDIVQDEISKRMKAGVVKVKPQQRKRRDPQLDRIEAVKKLIASGVPNEEILHELGMSARTLFSIIKENALPTVRERNKRAFAERDAHIIELRRSGLSTKEIASRFGLSRNTVQKIAKGIAP